MAIPVFLSFPKPHMKVQETFVRCVTENLKERGLETKTLGSNEYNMNAPLAGVRQLMMESNGTLVVAFKRYLDRKRTGKAWFRSLFRFHEVLNPRFHQR